MQQYILIKGIEKEGKKEDESVVVDGGKEENEENMAKNEKKENAVVGKNSENAIAIEEQCNFVAIVRDNVTTVVSPSKDLTMVAAMVTDYEKGIKKCHVYGIE